MAEVNLGTLYDFNKAAMEYEKPLDQIALGVEISKVIADLFEKGLNHYYMLLCRERNDYTIFFINEEKKDNLYKKMMNTLNNRGKILSIDKLPDGAYEIWIKDEFENNEIFVYYLFNYDIGVVDCSDE